MKKTLLALSVSVLAATTFNVNADALIGSKLQTLLPTLVQSTKVIVSTHHYNELDNVMTALNVPYLALKVLPMAGTSLTRSQINSLAKDSRVKSIYFDAPLEYYNYNSGEITSGHLVHDDYGVYGEGSTIAVLDSGVDATHPDLLLGEKTIQNVKIVGDLDFAGGKNLFLEGVPNSDTSSGHGTHVGGTVASSGEASRDDERRSFYQAGIAPKATLVGLGAGEAISILYAIAGFDYAIANSERYSIDVITNSWGGGDGASFDPNNPTNQASYQAYKKGIVVTFAASNSGPDDNTLNQYAIAPWVINVAAGTTDRQLADFSSRGVEGDWIKTPDITAPGSAIVSTRALNTPLGAAGPIIDPAHPEYHLYYASMSGTSMATPFVAGVVGLLLEVNPLLSPDQVEQILKDSADEMPGYKVHQVGAGHINVKAAVDLARVTIGERADFINGQTGWSSQGVWSEVSETDNNINYKKRWAVKNSTLSSDGTFKQTRRRNAQISFDFIGDSVQLKYITNNRKGHAELFLDGKSQGLLDYYSPQRQVKTVAFRDLSTDSVHSISLKRVNGTVSFDGILLDGQLVDSAAVIIKTDSNFAGSVGPSYENMEVSDHDIQLTDNVSMLNAVLTWSGVADLDFDLLNEAGEVVANSASLDNPEEINFRPTGGGLYSLRVNGYISVATDYTIAVTTSKLETND
jgi:serine protease AprX